MFRIFRIAFVVLVLALVVETVCADTPVIGFISQDTTWTKAGNPYVALGHVIVKEGITLTIESGVMVDFGSSYNLKIEGALIARGTETDNIVLTSKNTSIGSWKGIVFGDRSLDAKFDKNGNYLSGSILQHCVIEYAEIGVKGDSASPFISHCRVTNNSDRGIEISGGDVFVVRDSTAADNNGRGISIGGSNVVILIRNTIKGNKRGGVAVSKSNNVTIGDNIIAGNMDDWLIQESPWWSYYGGAGAGGGVYISECDIISLNTNTIEENVAKGRGAFGGGIYISNGNTVTVSGNVISGNTVGSPRDEESVYGGGMYARVNEKSGVVTVEGNTFAENKATGGSTYAGYGGWACGGGLYVVGGKSFISDNSFTGNTLTAGTGTFRSVDGSACGGGLYIDSSVATISKNIFAGNSLVGGGDGSALGGGVYIKGAPTTISNNTFSKNTGWAIYMSDVTSLINGNIFTGGENGIHANIAGATPIIGNTFTENSGKWMIAYRGSGVISGNTITNNRCASCAVNIEGTPRFNKNAVFNNLTDWNLYYSESIGSPALDATNNYWGVITEAEIRAKIYDFFQDDTLALVNVVPFLTEIPSMEDEEKLDVAKLKDTINAKLVQRPIYPPYLLDVDSFNSAVNTIWQNFTDWFRVDDLTDNYDELYFTGIEYDSLRYTALIRARDFLNKGDVPNAKKYLEKADTYEKLSQLSFQGANYVFEANLEAARIIAQSIKDGCQASVKFGLKFVSPTAAKGADFLYDVLDLGIQYYLGNQDEATKDFLLKQAMKLVFNEVRFEKLGGKTVSNWIENRTGKYLFPVLTEITKSEEWQHALSGVIKEGVSQVTKETLIEITTFITNEATKAVNSLKAELGSPAEIRIYNSQGQVTGLVNGKVMSEIPTSVYDNETVIIFFPTDVYRYEVVGTEEGKYGLKVVSIVDGSETTFLAIDIPTSAKAVHQYTVDWDILSKGKEGVTVKIDTDGDGSIEHTLTADIELTSEEYSAAAGVTPSGKQFTTWGKVRKSDLFQNYPNPFNPETWIPYQLAEESEAVIRIFSATGELVRAISLGSKPAGLYLGRDTAVYWDGCDEAGEPVASGVYFYTLQAGSFCKTKKMVIVR